MILVRSTPYPGHLYVHEQGTASIYGLQWRSSVVLSTSGFGHLVYRTDYWLITQSGLFLCRPSAVPLRELSTRASPLQELHTYGKAGLSDYANLAWNFPTFALAWLKPPTLAENVVALALKTGGSRHQLHRPGRLCIRLINVFNPTVQQNKERAEELNYETKHCPCQVC